LLSFFLEVQEMEANLPVTCSVKFLNINELHRFELIVNPNESFWSGGRFVFSIEIPDDYNFVVGFYLILN